MYVCILYIYTYFMGISYSWVFLSSCIFLVFLRVMDFDGDFAEFFQVAEAPFSKTWRDPAVTPTGFARVQHARLRAWARAAPAPGVPFSWWEPILQIPTRGSLVNWDYSGITQMRTMVLEYTHLHKKPQKWPSFVGKYSSTMEHLGNGMI